MLLEKSENLERPSLGVYEVVSPTAGPSVSAPPSMPEELCSFP